MAVLRLNEELRELAGAHFLATATDPLVIEVTTQVAIDLTPRTSSPIILLNGENLMNTRGLPGRTNKLVAFLPDRSLIRERNTVAVFWLGNRELTMTRRPLTFTRRDVPN